MKRTLCTLVWLGGVALVGSACSGDKKSADVLDAGPSGRGGRGGMAGQPDAGGPEIDASTGPQPRDAGMGGAGGEAPVSEPDAEPPAPPDGNCTIAEGADEISAPTGVDAAQCFGVSWGAGSAVDSITTGDEQFVAVTPDETNIAWLAPWQDDPDQLAIHYAWRNSAIDPFEPPGIIEPGAYDAESGIALSADGLRLVVVMPGRRGFTEYVRDSVLDAFSIVPTEAQFAMLNAQISHYLSPDTKCGDPLLSSDDLTLYFSVYDFDESDGEYENYDGAYTIYASTRVPYVSWPTGEPLLGNPLTGQCEFRRRPTGISDDQLTLFYWDELTQSERAAFRPAQDEPFNGAVEIGHRPGAQPNADCTQLYYSDPNLQNVLISAAQ
jgi:hypothetical protein